MRRRLGSRDRSTIRNPEKFEFAGSSRAPLTAEPGERCAVGIGSNGLRPGDGCGPPICRGGPLCSRRWHSEGASLPLTDSSLAPFSAVGRPHCQQRPQGLDGGSTHLSCGHYSRPLGAREVRLFRGSEQTETLEQTTYTPLFTVHTPVVDGGRTFGGARSGLDSNRPFAVGGLQQRWLSAARHVAFRGARRHGFI